MKQERQVLLFPACLVLSRQPVCESIVGVVTELSSTFLCKKGRRRRSVGQENRV